MRKLRAVEEIQRSTEPSVPGASASLELRDREILAAFRFFLGWRRWTVADLARAAGLARTRTSKVVQGEPSETPLLRQLCDALGIPLWLFWWVGTALTSSDEPRDVKALWPHLVGPQPLDCHRGFEMAEEGITLMLARGRMEPRPR